MKEFHSLTAFAEHLGHVALVQHEATHHALDKATELLQRKAKEKIGEYQDAAPPFAAWAQLADATIEARERAGYPGDEPLLVTGEMRDSIERHVEGSDGQVGSNSDIMVYQELGTAHIPPRSVLGATGVEQAGNVMKIVGETAVLALCGESVLNGRFELLNGAKK